MTQKELHRMDDLQRQIERLEKKLMALQEAFVCSVTWTAQTAGSPLGQADVKIILEKLK
jgi:hypothetical protein